MSIVSDILQWCAAGKGPNRVLSNRQGGNSADLSETGGAGQVLMQESVGAPTTVRVLASTELSDTAGLERIANKGVASGYAPLSSGLLVPEKYNAPHSRSIRREMRVTSNIFDSTFSTFGCAAPTTEGTLTAVDDADGSYVRATTAASVDTNAGFYIPAITKRRLLPDVVVVVQGTYADTRLFFGLASADPIGLTTFTSIKCAGWWYDYVVHLSAGDYRVVTSDGAAQTETQTNVNTGSPSLVNKWVAFRIRNTATTSWEFSRWDTSALGWTSVYTHTMGSGLALGDSLGLYMRVRTLSGSAHSVGLSHLVLISD